MKQLTENEKDILKAKIEAAKHSTGQQETTVLTAQDARNNIRKSFIWLGIGCALGFFIAICFIAKKVPFGTGYIGPLFFIPYISWGLYWGFKWIWPLLGVLPKDLWRWWRDSPMFWWLGFVVTAEIFLIYILFILAYGYGIFGGGIYQHYKNTKIASRG